MRKVATYDLRASAEGEAGQHCWDAICPIVEGWLDSKGTRHSQDARTVIRYRDGREADLSFTDLSGPSGRVRRWSLEEPTATGHFRTTIHLGIIGHELMLCCELEAGNRSGYLAPTHFDPRCPRVVRDVIELDIPWQVNGVRPTSRPARYSKSDEGQRLARLIVHPERRLPLIVVSTYERLTLHPGIEDDLARDLAGLALVALCEPDASWATTQELGHEWSCYNGAIRLYWPMAAVQGDPFKHPLWTSTRLLDHSRDTQDAARRIRSQLRRKILGLSTLTFRRDPRFPQVEREHRRHLLRSKAQSPDADIRQIYEEENEELNQQVGDLEFRVLELEEENSALKVDLENAQLLSQYAHGAPNEPSDILPDNTPPTTIREAVERARDEYSDRLIFGDDVESGVAGLASNAGPPEKVLLWLGTLAELADQLRAGAALGASQVQWLKDKGIDCSIESDTVRNSTAEMRKRTWHDGERPREFIKHMKPAEATRPDRCVRIYFDQGDDKLIVGWVGRHP